jgi:hypothetical protein
MKTLVSEHVEDSNRDGHFVARVVAMAVTAAVFAYALGCLVLNVDTRELGYHESGGVSYQVCLKPNSYFADECQPAGKQYVASLINSVKTNFDYGFQIDEPMNYDYSYDVTARLVATESGDSDKVLYENQEVILPRKNFDGQSGQSFRVQEAIDIDYGKFNNLITAFRSDYGLTINSYVVISLNLKIHGQPPEFKKPLDASQTVALKIPLSERTINVNLQSDSLSSDGKLEETAPNLAKNLVYVVVGLVSLVVLVSLLVGSIVVLLRREARRSAYDKALEKILHEYNQLIVEVEHIPQIPRNNVVEVTNFDELLDARDTIQQPILHLALADDRSLFIIEDQGLAYVYIMSAKPTTQQSAAQKSPNADR